MTLTNTELSTPLGCCSVDGPWETTQNGLRAHLRRVGTGPFGDDLPRIVFTLEQYGDDLIRFKVSFTVFILNL